MVLHLGSALSKYIDSAPCVSLNSCQIPPTRPPPAQLAKPEGDASFTMCIASGPYTLDSDMRFKPWKAFVTAVTKDRPDAILLVSRSYLLGANTECVHRWAHSLIAPTHKSKRETLTTPQETSSEYTSSSSSMIY